MILKRAVLILPLLFLIFLFYSGSIRYSVLRNRAGKRVLVQRSVLLKNHPDCTRARRWIAERWMVNEDQIYLVVVDNEPWMNICGFVDIQSYTSAKVLIINNDEGMRTKTQHERLNTPNYENMYLSQEYKPKTENEKNILTNYYSLPNYWRENLTGELTIVENISWHDETLGNGTITAYQSQDILPSISVPIETGALKRWRTFPTPIGN